uniref:Uncharacterized protein n=1 Tax=Meloidogyne enterolobii TaxID=390850 RepID=A0A6V7WY33_MELEN|nr:unnamed protein product [Meloidogyne enterolobii]
MFTIIIPFLFFLGQSVYSLSGGQWSILASSPHSSNNWIQEQQRHQETSKCLNISERFTLCHGMQYKTMRLPNLLEHETMEEAIQQSSAWISLLRLHCHPHTKLFLCSLFAPICLPQIEKPIHPCESLCNAVREGCATRMEKYGFPWPEMLNCSQFPSDNDLCIKPPSSITPTTDEEEERKRKYPPPLLANVKGQVCKSCAQVATFENLMDNFCRSSIVLKVRIRAINSTYMAIIKRMRIFKSSTSSASGSIGEKSTRDPIEDKHILIKLSEHGETRCYCPFAEVNTSSLQGEAKERQLTFLVMASEKRRNGELLNAKLIVPWRQEKSFKQAIRRFKKLNCNTLGREIRESVLNQMFRRKVPRGRN